jgi:hypothetical protein
MLPACKPGSVECYLVTVIPLGAWSPTPSSSLPAASCSGRAVPRCLFGLAPAGVCRAADVTTCAVSSYLTVSPLPVHRRTGAIGGLFSVALSVEAIASPRSYLAACPVEPGLSSSACALATIRPTASI